MVKKGLGKGLDALFAVYDEEEKMEKQQVEAPKNVVERAPRPAGVTEIDIKLIDPNKNQPRKTFDPEALKEMAESIRQHGIIQPIVVNDMNNGRYMIIAGERRFRGSLIAGLRTVPVVIKNYTDKQVQEVSLIENLQREDLNPIESARAIKQLMDTHGFTQESVADRIGKSRSAIANTLRLLSLRPEVMSLVEKGRLSAGHARALITVVDPDVQLEIARKACDNKLSVREVEKLVKDYFNPKTSKAKDKPVQSRELKALVADMQRAFATKVSVIGNDKKGRIYIDYYSTDDLDRIASIISRH